MKAAVIWPGQERERSFLAALFVVDKRNPLARDFKGSAAFGRRGASPIILPK
jgi:hypothetical protein